MQCVDCPRRNIYVRRFGTPSDMTFNLLRLLISRMAGSNAFAGLRFIIVRNTIPAQVMAETLARMAPRRCWNNSNVVLLYVSIATVGTTPEAPHPGFCPPERPEHAHRNSCGVDSCSSACRRCPIEDLVISIRSERRFMERGDHLPVRRRPVSRNPEFRYNSCATVLALQTVRKRRRRPMRALVLESLHDFLPNPMPRPSGRRANPTVAYRSPVTSACPCPPACPPGTRIASGAAGFHPHENIGQTLGRERGVHGSLLA